VNGPLFPPLFIDSDEKVIVILRLLEMNHHIEGRYNRLFHFMHIIYCFNKDIKLFDVMRFKNNDLILIVSLLLLHKINDWLLNAATLQSSFSFLFPFDGRVQVKRQLSFTY